MSSFESKRRLEPHLKVPEDATEPQALIFQGEEVLEHAHQISHGIEERIHRLLDDCVDVSSPSSQLDQFLSNRCAGNGQGEAKDAVDNRRRRW